MSISIIIKNIRNLLPYFLLIAIYFFFVNLEASKDKDNDPNNIKENIIPDHQSTNVEEKLRIQIPVIPYNQ